MKICKCGCKRELKKRRNGTWPAYATGCFTDEVRSRNAQGNQSTRHLYTVRTPVVNDIRQFLNEHQVSLEILARSSGVPKSTINSILYNTDRKYVKKDIANKITEGIRNYDPRDHDDRLIPRQEVARIIRMILDRNGWTIKHMAEVVGVKRPYLSDILSEKSRRRTVQAKVVKRIVLRSEEERLRNAAKWEQEQRYV